MENFSFGNIGTKKSSETDSPLDSLTPSTSDFARRGEVNERGLGFGIVLTCIFSHDVANNRSKIVLRAHHSRNPEQFRTLIF